MTKPPKLAKTRFSLLYNHEIFFHIGGADRMIKIDPCTAIKEDDSTKAEPALYRVKPDARVSSAGVMSENNRLLFLKGLAEVFKV